MVSKCVAQHSIVSQDYSISKLDLGSDAVDEDDDGDDDGNDDGDDDGDDDCWCG